MANTNRPVEAYPSEYIEFLRQAAVERKEVRFVDHPLRPAKKRAWYVRAQLAALRSRMKKDNHPLYDTVAKVSFSIQSPEGLKLVKAADYHAHKGDVILVGQLGDSHILADFHAAGIKPDIIISDDNDPLAKL